MSMYKVKLPEVFPYCVQVVPHQIDHLVNKIMGYSSFAVTVEDIHNGYYNLWLSQTSLDELNKTDCLNGSQVFSSFAMKGLGE